MDRDQFEAVLDALAVRLTEEVRTDAALLAPTVFEAKVRTDLGELLSSEGVAADLNSRPQAFPDIVYKQFGIEVKFTDSDSWRSIANSVFEGSRDARVKHIYLLFGKIGGTPAVRWNRYEDCVMHVRTSHVPRFEVEIDAKEPLFAKFGIPYDEFRNLAIPDKMTYIRTYARARLKPGDRLWWLEDKPESAQQHSLDLEVRLYMGLNQVEKRRLRAEAALLCPQVVRPPRSKKKYDDAAMYLLTYRGVLCPQARDLFTAGSVAMRADQTRGGNYMVRSLQDIEAEMRKAALELEDALFVEYWGLSVPANQRISKWLELADGYATDWVPSKVLFMK
ncbi:MAG: restriction endonuclease [Syntrophobacteraceae bacterium]